MAKYKDIGPGESFPVYKNMKISCCDCGLVHKLEIFNNEEAFMMIKMTRDRRATAAIRREARKRRIKESRQNQKPHRIVTRREISGG